MGRLISSELDRFVTALWLERGLSENTQQAYRRDVEGAQYWRVVRVRIRYTSVSWGETCRRQFAPIHLSIALEFAQFLPVPRARGRYFCRPNPVSRKTETFSTLAKVIVRG